MYMAIYTGISLVMVYLMSLDVWLWYLGSRGNLHGLESARQLWGASEKVRSNARCQHGYPLVNVYITIGKSP